MLVIRSLGDPVFEGDRSVVTIGAYDGLHRGHIAVISSVVERAQKVGQHSAVVTFDRHPASVVRPESAPLLITSLEQRIELLRDTGLDAVVVLEFDEVAASEEAEDFINRVFVDGLAASEIIVGEDFHFGRGRRGNVEMLSRIGREHDFVVTPLSLRTTEKSEVISSTAIRAALRRGDLDGASNMLGRTVTISGRVVHGDERGRTIGFPTANVDVNERFILPADGVYAAWCLTEAGGRYSCAVNIGKRPTFYGNADRSLVECHLLDFSGDLYDQVLTVEFADRLRDEQRFDGLEALTTQLQIDVARAREIARL
ncbi:MAG: bifunctional riboflavin kinase/FAD synthetase [Actinomycetota bacterium]|nr:bifunctional riboflavin kinase/FAD synthetase [Actinomycetota bacterium]MEC7174695.1 bifunctional riboflavin kinase/FAD synthetase [Actinomycetota bacterium]MEC7457099.1 bifunctional riboflavin kinase/FAD synthetase [Actinomycetota bacterium]MEC8018947.1 bifunctional riboflavin kinase/FAD synthetase [Actinomycetota bacterium]MEC8486379.1 bifunctional riboflavin kinase/FAD synthetase [Actinomycetota bacterium]